MPSTAFEAHGNFRFWWAWRCKWALKQDKTTILGATKGKVVNNPIGSAFERLVAIEIGGSRWAVLVHGVAWTGPWRSNPPKSIKSCSFPPVASNSRQSTNHQNEAKQSWDESRIHLFMVHGGHDAWRRNEIVNIVAQRPTISQYCSLQK